MSHPPAPHPHVLRTAAATAAVMVAAAVIVAVHITPWALLAWPLSALALLAVLPTRHTRPSTGHGEDHQVPEQPYDVELDLTDDDHLVEETPSVFEADHIGPAPSQDPAAPVPDGYADRGVAETGP